MFDVSSYSTAINGVYQKMGSRTVALFLFLIATAEAFVGDFK